jgi:hypothetical protein
MFGGRGGNTVCKFFLQGNCRFGGMLAGMANLLDGLMEPKLTPIPDNCRNEHPSGQDNAQSQGNRFAPLNNNNNNNNNNGGGARNRSGGYGSSSMSLSFQHFFPFLTSCFSALAS